MAEIKAKANSFAANLKTQLGITNVTMSVNDADLIIKLSFDFNSVLNFKNGLEAAVTSIRNSKQGEELNHNWISWDGKILKRNIPLMSLTISEQLKEAQLKLTASMMRPSEMNSIDKEKWEKQIDQYIKEIDTAIKNLNP